jgi:ribA/ribD-fused uncharacterized protein
MIEKFVGKYRFLSNFYESRFVVNGVEYKSVEHFYQSMKCVDVKESEMIRLSETPGKAKRLGKRCKIHSNWNSIKLQVMEIGLRAKFTQNPDLLALLLSTGVEILQEGNTWGDTFWGVDLRNKEGENHLGKPLMSLREEFSTKNK